MPDANNNVPVRVKDYVDARFSDHDKRHDTERYALEAAKAATDTRLASMNEWRASLQDITATYVSRDVVEAMFKVQNARMDIIAAAAQRAVLQAGIAAGVVVAVIGFLLSRVVP